MGLVYFGGDAVCAQGSLRGHSGLRDSLYSKLLDLSVEGRVGFTFQQESNFQASISPFVGLGYLTEINHFERSSPLHVHLRTYFSYIALGFLSWAHLSELFEVGINFKAKLPVEPKCRVSHDPDNSPLTQKVAQRWHYRVDLPLTYRLFCDGRMAVSAVPFFEYRDYGEHFNFPFNFIKTELSLFGLTLALQYRL